VRNWGRRKNRKDSGVRGYSVRGDGELEGGGVVRAKEMGGEKMCFGFLLFKDAP